MDKIYIVTQLTNLMEIEDERAFMNYEAAARYFKAILGEWLLVYLTEPDIPFERDKKDFSDGAGAKLFEIPCNAKSFEQHEDYVQVLIENGVLIVLRAVDLEFGEE